MNNRLLLAIAGCLAMTGCSLISPDAQSVLQSSQKAMGSVKSIQYSGSGMNAFMPLPEYWMDFTLPIAFCELCSTDWASGLMSEQPVIARHPAIASKSLLFIIFFEASFARISTLSEKHGRASRGDGRSILK